MKVRFFDSAKAEFLESVSFYNLQSEGLGYELATEVHRTIQRIIQYPKAWAKLSERTRRCRVNRFPYGVIYQVREETLLIVAVMHLSREPQTWKSRLRGKDL